MKNISLILFLLYQLLFSTLWSQSNYPVYVSPSLIPPYSLKLSDYGAFGSQRLMVTIVVNDLDVANLPVKLRIRMETAGVTIENPPTINTTPIFLDGGSATILFGEELADYFSISNLQFKGYSKEAYRVSGQLPEGFYRFTVEVLHFHTNRVISNAGTTTAWIALGKPPVLRMPANDVELGEYAGMPITFSWLSSSVGSPVSAGSIRYRFEMWEMRIPGISPYSIAASMPVFHEHTTGSTFYSLNPASLMMEEGMSYAWRVTAYDESDFVPFEQDGRSEVRTFSYKSLCEGVTAIETSVAGQKGSFVWVPEGNHTSYNVEVRNNASGWFSAGETFNSKVEYYELERGQTYELRVQSVCNGNPGSTGDFSEWTVLTIPDAKPRVSMEDCPGCGCDDNIPKVELTNFELRRNLSAGDTLSNKTGTTRFIVRSAEPQGDGVYKGLLYFWAEIWGAKILCEYWDLQVNSDNVIVNMDYKSIDDPRFLLDVDAIAGGVNNLLDNAAQFTSNGTIKDTIQVLQDFDYIEVKDGQLVAIVLDENGYPVPTPLNISVEEAEKALITNGNGDEAVITSKGEVMGAKEYQATGGGNSRLMKNYNKEKESNDLAGSGMVEFSAHPGQKYGFDAYTEQKQAILNNYPTLNNGYRPAFKSVESFGYDKVGVSSREGLTFRDEMGVPAADVGEGVSVRGSNDGSVRALYAYRDGGEKEEIVGKLNVMSFDNQPMRVYIVPVNDAHLPSARELQQTLNEVYRQAVTTWTVVEEPGITISFPDGKMTHGGSGDFDTYNTDQKLIVETYTSTGRQLERNALYLFFVEGVTFKERSIAGFMPLQRQAGFIYDNPGLVTVAHELAHGAFNLRHTFSPQSFIVSEGQTQNLMDYTGGTELWQHQWKSVQDPQRILFAFMQDEGEGAMMNLNMSEESIKGVINLIRESNIAKEKTVDLSIFSLSKGGSVNLKLTDNFTLEYVEVSIGSGKYIGNQDIPFLFEPLTIKPMELKCVKIANPPLQREDFVHISFNRFDQAAPPRMGIVESDSVGISFIVKLSQKDEFEAYLKNELYAKAIWVSQFDETVFRDCTCFPQRACCFYASQYIVKNSTKLYSPNGNQIATMRFPINDAPLISMQTPMSIPSGFKSGVAYLDASLAEGKPIVVGVYYRGRQELQQRRTAEAQERLNAAQENLNALIEEIEMIGETEALLRQREVLENRLNAAQQDYNEISQRGRINSVEPTFHYVVVVAKGYDIEQQRGYYRFQEVGVGTENPINGTHNGNRFYIYDDKLKGRQGFSAREYIVTEVRQHRQTGRDCTN